MKTFEIDQIRGRDKFESAVVRQLGAGYDPESWREAGSTEQWSLTELILSDSRAARAALCYLSGYDPRGSRLPRESQPQEADQRVSLRVLSRMACHADKDGKRISTNVREPGCVNPEDKPREGDVVRVKQGPLTRHPQTGEAISPAAKANMIMLGIETDSYRSYRVDADGFIEVDIADALYLLKIYSRLSGRPQYNTLTLVSQGATAATVTELKQLNWLFEEAARPDKPKRSQRVAQE